MDSLLPYSLIFFSIIISLLFAFLLKNRTASKNLRLPPGPSPLPIIGNIHCLIGSPLHHVARDLSHQYGPLLLLQLGETPTIIASSIEATREILKTHDINFASRPISPTVSILSGGGKGIGFTSYGEHWRYVRKICIVELFTNKRVQSSRSIREEEVNNLARNISTSSSCGELIDLQKVLTALANDITVKTVVGTKCKDPHMYMKELEKMLDLVSGFSLVDLYPSSRLLRLISKGLDKAKRSHERVHQFLDDIIEQQRKRRATVGDGTSEDFLSILLSIHDEDTGKISLDINNVKTIINDLFAGGSETAATTVEWAMAELIRNPRVMKQVQSEVREILRGCTSVIDSDLVRLNYLQLVIKETLRLHPPAPMLMPRQCRETCCILGYDIPKGATVLVNVWAIGRDPRYWEDPEQFRPERFINSNVDFKGTDFEFLPFGSGRRMCPGMSLGIANVELALASLLYHFDWKLPNNITSEEVDMSETVGITARKKAPLLLHAVQQRF